MKIYLFHLDIMINKKCTFATLKNKHTGKLKIHPKPKQMNQIHILTLIILLIVLLNFNVEGQESENQENRLFKPNSLSGSLGFAGVVGTATINIERIVTQSPNKKITATFAKAGYGIYGSWGDEGSRMGG